MKKLFSTILTGAFIVGACFSTAGSLSAQTTGMKAPKIPIPTGDVRKQAPQPGTPPKIQIGKAETFQLDNGLKVIVVENHKLPRVSFRVFVDYDPVTEKDAAGYVDMMGELLSKGTKTRDKAKIDQSVDFLGASISSDANGVSGSSLTKHTEKLLEIMSDVLLNPTFPAEELEKSKTRTESGLASEKDDANAIAGKVGAVLRYGKGHPYGEVMTEETLAKISLDQIKNHYNTYFKPNISYLVITGDITKAKAEKLAKKYFGKWTKGDVPKNNYALPRPPEKTQVDFVHKAGAVQSNINSTYPIELTPGAPEAIRARVANTVFGGYFNSRINANLREGHGWTYGSRSSINPDILVGSFNAGAQVRNAVTDSAIIELVKEMNRMRDEKVPVAELQVVKNVLAGQFSQSLEQPGTVAQFALNIARYNLPANYYEQYLENLQAVTPEDVLMMSKKYIRPDRAHILVVGSKDDVSERLKQFAEGGKINYYDVYGNPVKISNIQIQPGTTAQQVIDDYVNAIGGAAAIAKLKDVQMTGAMKTRGPELGIKTFQKGGDKIVVEMSMNGQTMSKQVFDGVKGAASGMGMPPQAIEGEDLEDMKEQAAFSKEALYKSKNYKLALKGAEEVEGANAYVIEVERPDGSKTTEYYDMKTSLKLREVSSSVGQDGQPAVQTTDFSNYKEVGGVKFAHTMTISGMFPIPVKLEVSEYKVNAGIDDSMFK